MKRAMNGGLLLLALATLVLFAGALAPTSAVAAETPAPEAPAKAEAPSAIVAPEAPVKVATSGQVVAPECRFLEESGVNLSPVAGKGGGKPGGDRCCNPDDEPGTNGNPFCFEGHTCCSDGRWSCNNADASPSCDAGEVCTTGCGGKGDACESGADCCSGACKGNGTCR